MTSGGGMNFGVTVPSPFPAGPARKVTLATTDGFAIYAGTEHPEAAWELVKFLISKDYGRAMARAHLLQPARASLVEEWVSLVREEYPEKAAEGSLKKKDSPHAPVTPEDIENALGDVRRLTEGGIFRA